MKLKDLEHEIAIKNDRIQRYDNEVGLLKTKIEESKPDKNDHTIEKNLKATLDKLTD